MTAPAHFGWRNFRWEPLPPGTRINPADSSSAISCRIFRGIFLPNQNRLICGCRQLFSVRLVLLATRRPKPPPWTTLTLTPKICLTMPMACRRRGMPTFPSQYPTSPRPKWAAMTPARAAAARNTRNAVGNNVLHRFLPPAIVALAVKVYEDVARFGTFAGADDAAAFEFIHDARGAGVTKTQATLHQ